MKAALAADQPAISVDTKKKELVGDFKNNGREYRPKGDPEKVRVHDFKIPELGRAAPYGVYDIADNASWVSVRGNRVQGDRISKQGQELSEVGVVPSGALELTAQGAFGGVFLHDVDGHVAQNGEVVWTVAQSAPVLILVHDDIEAPVQTVLDAPVRAHDLIEAFGG
ncbi:hypothetical protein MESS2_1650010 [Mesorhizobium metallidurans STM 2683]|uniref:Uncharacterized protein n=1 Tax=Mesorhizobium metallidurans STM 2683 TaxID=1297569 RepID=M5EN17_9HYPH|nr:hypothetical protein MESS2_1650010 [Mesorhizobium metallidurans STM 2683]